MWPVKPAKGQTHPRVTKDYRTPGAYLAGFHTGTDLGWTRPLERIRATYKGVVVKVVKGDRYYGNYLVIRHVLPSGEVRWSWYCHLASIRPTLRPGVRVGTGRLLGVMGATGNATGRHLHYEERGEPNGYHNHRRPVLLIAAYARAPKRLRGWK